MNEYVENIVNQIAEQIISVEGDDCSRKVQDQFHFLNGIEHLVIQLWIGTQIHCGYEGGIHKRAGSYSEYP